MCFDLEVCKDITRWTFKVLTMPDNAVKKIMDGIEVRRLFFSENKEDNGRARGKQSKNLQTEKRIKKFVLIIKVFYLFYVCN